MIFDYLTLQFIKGIGTKTANKMLHHFGSVQRILESSEEECRETGLSLAIWNDWEKKKDMARRKAEKEMLSCQKLKVNLLCQEDDAYPHALRLCHDAPILLYYVGTPIFNRMRGVAIVGTRRASSYGKEQTQQMISFLKTGNIYTISGLALGIDTQAHRSSIENHIPTVAVVSHGLEKIYPEENLSLAREIVYQGGCIISETPFYTHLKAGMFPRRNRIIAGLCEICVVAEASMKGGAMLTASWAESYQRCIMAVPGRNDQYYYEGCNALIKKGSALLLENGNDIRRELGLAPLTQGVSPEFLQDIANDETMLKILHIFEKENPASCELIQHESGLSWPDMLEILLKLEMLGLVRNIPGNRYEKTAGYP